jgi:hypothetical protein
MPLPIKTWKTRPAHSALLEMLARKGAVADTDLFETVKEEFDDLGFKDFNTLLMRLEVSGKIRVTSTARGKRRIELVT